MSSNYCRFMSAYHREEFTHPIIYTSRTNSLKCKLQCKKSKIRPALVFQPLLNITNYCHKQKMLLWLTDVSFSEVCSLFFKQTIHVFKVIPLKSCTTTFFGWFASRSGEVVLIIYSSAWRRQPPGWCHSLQLAPSFHEEPHPFPSHTPNQIYLQTRCNSQCWASEALCFN